MVAKFPQTRLCGNWPPPQTTVNGGMSTWGWAQNSLVGVDIAAKTFRYNHDYYLPKHLTHFVEVGAKCVETTGTFGDAFGFVNPDETRSH